MKTPMIEGRACVAMLSLFFLLGCGENTSQKGEVPTASKSLEDKGMGSERIEIHYTHDKFGAKTGWVIQTAGGKPIVKAERVDKVKGTFIYKVSPQQRFEYDGGNLLQYRTGLEYITTDNTVTRYNEYSDWRCEFQYGTHPWNSLGFPTALLPSAPMAA